MSRKDKMFATLAREHADAQAEIARLKDEIAKQMLADEMLRGLYDDEAADVARLNAELRALRAGQDALVAAAYEAAVQTIDTAGDCAVTDALGQQLCCSGQDCGCQGATVGEYLTHLIRALTPADATAALDALLLAERNKALRDAAEVCVEYGLSKAEECHEAILAMIETEGK